MRSMLVCEVVQPIHGPLPVCICILGPLGVGEQCDANIEVTVRWIIAAVHLQSCRVTIHVLSTLCCMGSEGCGIV